MTTLRPPFANRRRKGGPPAVTENGEPTSKITIEDVKVNPAVDPKAFEKPAGASPGGM